MEPQRQLTLVDLPVEGAPQVPEGLIYRPELVTPAEEKELVSWVEGLDYREVKMRGHTARRTVRHFGLRYDYGSYRLTPSDPFPSRFDWLRERCAELAETQPELLVQALITRYPPGAGIGWHRDAPRFGPKVMGVSLLSGCRMRFDTGSGDARTVFYLELEPRSAYVIGGAARSEWRHSIPATRELRYSITFRTLKDQG